MKKILLCGVLLAAILVVISCGGTNNSSPAIQAPTGQTQTAVGSVEGHVVQNGQTLSFGQTQGSSGTPLGGVSVVVVNPFDTSGTLLASAQTDSNGHFLLTNVPIGLQTLQVSPPSTALTIPITVLLNATVDVDTPAVSRAAAIKSAQQAAGAVASSPTLFVIGPSHPLPAGVDMAPGLGGPNGQDDPSLHVILNAPQWFFLFDPTSYNHFQHAVDFILVDAQSGTAQVVPASSFPSLNGNLYYNNPNATALSPDIVSGTIGAPDPTFSPNPAPAHLATVPLSPPQSSNCDCSNPVTYALLIQGADSAVGPKDGAFENSISDVKNMLNSGVFSSPQITTIQTFSRPTNKDPFGVFRTAFNQICAKARTCDTIFIYYDGHGAPASGGVAVSETGTSLIGATVPTADFNFTSLDFSNCQACRVIMIIDACGSGGLTKDGTKTPAIPGIDTKPGRDITVLTAASEGKDSNDDTALCQHLPLIAGPFQNVAGPLGCAFTSELTNSFSLATSSDPSSRLLNAFDRASIKLSRGFFTGKCIPTKFHTTVPGSCCSTPTSSPSPSPSPSLNTLYTLNLPQPLTITHSIANTGCPTPIGTFSIVNETNDTLHVIINVNSSSNAITVDDGSGPGFNVDVELGVQQTLSVAVAFNCAVSTTVSGVIDVHVDNGTIAEGQTIPVQVNVVP